MRRYEKLYNYLSKKRSADLYICQAAVCGCRGCAGSLGGDRITQRELDLFLSGDLKRIVDKGNNDEH